jgi:Leucine-rich repeat (LRR) protein
LEIEADCEVSDTGIDVIRSFPDLRELKLTGFAKLSVKSVAAALGLRKLRVLVLNLNGDAFRGLNLENVNNLADLESLSLNGAPITDQGLSHLKVLSNLKELDLVGSHEFSPRGLASLMGSLPRLRKLRISLDRD